MAGAWSKQHFGTPVPKVFASTGSSKEICSSFLRTAVLSLQSAITQAQPQAMLKAWVSGPAWGLPTELQNKCIVFIWKMQTHNSPPFYNSLRFCGKSAEKKSTKLLSGPHFTVQMKNPSESRCTEMLIWYNDHNVMLFFPFFLTGKQWYLKKSYLSPCSRIAGFALYSY